MPLKTSTKTAKRSALKPHCRHCGAPAPANEAFCCAGCAYVYRLVHDEGLDAYYQIKDDVTVPAAAVLEHTRDYGWLRNLQHEAETQASDTGRTPRLQLAVQGLSCAGCVWLIERLFAKVPGAGRIEINAQTGQLRLSWRRDAQPTFEAADFAATLQRFNYLLGPPGAAVAGISESRDLVKRIGLCAAFVMNVMLFTLPAYFGMEAGFTYARLFDTLALGFGTLSLLAGGGYFLTRAVRALREGAIHIDLPIAVGIVGAYAGSLYGWLTAQPAYTYFDFVSGFILLMLIGRWAQVAAVERNQRRLLQEQPTPPQVTVFEADGIRREVPPEQLMAGMCFAIPTGQTVPVQARLESDWADLNLAWINGESESRMFRAGESVAGGAQNVGRSEIRLCATQGWDESLLAQLLQPVTRETEGERLIERVIQAYLVAIFAIAGGAGIGWWWGTGDLLLAGAVVTAVLVVSCPCALGLAFPLADEMATVALRKRGVFVRAGDLWGRLVHIKKLVFDKTGTLTLENPVLAEPGEVDRLSLEARAVLFTMVRDNPHPVSRTLLAELVRGRLPQLIPAQIHEQVGAGVTLGDWSLGRAGWRDQGPADGATVLCHAGCAVARFVFRDQLRPDAVAEMSALADRGLQTFILSGDETGKVARMARDLGLPPDNAYGGQTPQAKAAWLLEHGAHDALMLGDGANDSLAFDAARCRGTPVVHRGVLAEKSDFYYLGQGLGGLRALFEVNDVRRRTQRVLLGFMVAYNLTAVGLAVAGWMSPLFAAVLMPLSSLATLAIVGIGMRRAWEK
ncbi:heavy metal translocating P-type ATPase metal-binding domain-containing protein [Synoicihabitans lomoniglobus]|uniref:Heavy metal translocating P-type ATPase metal-binding domain-containing protein n=1 Tax=Synoicihabitans lomoniglobus TaxID=2909285 RepID=A0AAE9ZUX9_9BACT|nr:heavy metal translocating P-type ATPase metal-binding domain-containing protein [Opitutaceae bacterium LMO-M01]WED63549.1 heavy metal translocating P-type ATPase metal-binding domain-containing protein [Opitutaceae bacterium LMO-M01]